MDIPLTLAEELFLLVHDDESGRPDATPAADQGYAGALLLELAAGGWLTANGEGALAPSTKDGVPEHGLLAGALTSIRADGDEPKEPQHWLNRLPKRLGRPLGDRVGDELVDRGILRREEHRTLRIFRSTRWPEADAGPEQELRGRLRGALLGGEEPEPRTGRLIAILHALGIAERAPAGDLSRDERKQAGAEAKRIAEREPDGETAQAVAAAVKAVQASLIMMTIMVPTIAATTST